MKRTFTALLAAFAVAAGLLASAFADDAGRKHGPLELKIKMSGTSLKAGSPVKCKMSLKNVGEKALAVNKRFLVNRPAPAPHEIYFIVKNAKGYQVPFRLMVRAGEATKSDIVKLGAGEAVSNRPDILFFEEDYGYDLAEAYGLDSPGTYTVQAVYEVISPPDKARCWTGRVLSNTVKLTLK